MLIFSKVNKFRVKKDEDGTTSCAKKIPLILKEFFSLKSDDNHISMTYNGKSHEDGLERLIDYEDDVLRFMTVACVPFTNNAAENSIRMTKVHQKISGSFRSMEGAEMFCRIRGYLTTCRKQGMSATQAMTLVFEWKLPEFAE